MPNKSRETANLVATSGVSTIRDLNATRVNVSGVGTISNGSITNLTGTSSTITTLRSTTGNFTTGNIVTGVTTNFNATNVVISGVTTVSTGTALLPSITPSGDPNTGIFFPAADHLNFSTGGTSRVQIESDGDINIDSGTVFVDAANNRFGIGTTSPDQLMTLNAANGYPIMSFQNNGTTVGDIGFNVGLGMILSGRSTNPILFYTDNLPRATIDSSGRLLVGTSSSRSWSGSSSQIQIEAAAAQVTQSIIANSADALGALLTLGKSRGTALASNTIVQADDILGRIYFYGADGSQLINGAHITAQVDGTPGTNDMPGRLVFSTTPDSGSSPTSSPPAMTIKSSQEVLIGTSTITANGGILQLKSGITFPATAVAASDVNTLDDYEEGTFTPTAFGETTAGTTTYTYQLGQYVKVGNMVTCTAGISVSNMTGTGKLLLGNLPFTLSNTTIDVYSPSIGKVDSLTFSNQLGLMALASTTYIRVISISSNSSYAQVNVDSYFEFYYTVTFFV